MASKFEGTCVYTTKPTINYVGFGKFDSTLQVDNFTLSVLKFPSRASWPFLAATDWPAAYAWRKAAINR